MTINASSPSTGITSCMLDADTIARIALACAGVSGDPTVAVAIETFGGAAPFVAAVHDGRDAAAALSPLTRQRVRAFARASRVAAVLESMAQHHITVLSPLFLEWPTQLSALRGAAPLVLFTRGDVATLTSPAIALTGTAAPTGFGIHLAIELGTGLAARSWGIAAGSGSGIDQLALKAARATCGRTITVAAASLDAHACDTRFGGVWVSELPPTAVVTVRSQRRGKHLLAAIAVKTILVEAGLSSGALRTVEAAHAMSRPVGVVLGPDGSPTSAGCRDLAVRHGLAPVASIVDADRLR